MKQLVALGSIGFLILLITACTPHTPPPARATNTLAFDGHYERPTIVAKSPGCPDLGAVPYVSISSGVATLQAPNYYFQGSVTPEGTLSMHSSSGQTFDGQIDPHFVLNAHISGPNCTYQIVWTKA